MDLYYFSYTGTSKEIALALARRFNAIPKEIKTYSFPYSFWLLLSFIPGFEIRANFEPPQSPYGVLVFPKWTFNCPPVTYFLKKISFEKLILIITYGGWREIPYGEYYKKLASKNCKEVEVIYIKRKLWERKKELSLLEIERNIKEVLNQFK
ncbi:hypothetical protein THC_0731 [Caldimicrobium thiodismutans]|uniref:Flavodoxin-like domain-containing protein n=1 Tax=Caldimicrobium thiodismutans TaxID=1653476 RepID=A0A0U5AMQ7_9BACT|nr:hypothetical protein [Caldimicrobium thiodismutans]BAU23122.1 hypothetical protein THC_0731 [Caldimicrobium thiodismutans]